MLKDILKITCNLDEVADTLSEGIRFLKEHNIGSAEVRTIDGKNVAMLTFEETRELKRVLDSNGISVASIASPLFKWCSGNLVSEREVDLFGVSPYLSREEKEEMIAKLIEQAGILETKKIRIFSGLKSNEGYGPLPEEESELLLFALKKAKEKDVQLLLENEPVCNVSRLSDYIGMFTSGKYEGLRAWFDIANIYEEGERISEEDLMVLAPYIGYLHVKDPIAPKVHKYKPLGKGYINYKYIFGLMEDIIQNPLYLSIETHVKDDKWNASSESLDYLHRILNTRRTRYALVGTGRVSKKHFSAIKENDNCALIGVFDNDAEKSRSTAFEHDCINYASYEDMLKDGRVDVVSICTPHDIHMQIAEAALKNGKKVLCEKPLALSSAELERYITNFDKNDDTFVVFQNRFNPAVKKFYKFEKEELGDPQYISMALRWWRDVEYYRDWHGSQEISGGPLITQAIHSLELITHLTKGGEIKSIRAIQLKTRDEVALPDVVVALVEFDNGVVCNIEVCMATRYRNLESSVFVVGTKGSVKIAGVALSEFVHPQSEGTEQDKHNEHYYGNGHTALYKTLSNHFLQIPDQDESLLTSPDDLVHVMKLIEAIESAVVT